MVEKRFLVAMYPWFAMGHLTTFLHLSNKLVERGQRFKHFNYHPSLITFIPLTILHVEGLPPNTEITNDIPYPLHPLLMKAMDQIKPFMEATLGNLKPQCIFFDFAHWIPELARGLVIKSIDYCTISPGTIGYLGSPARKIHDNELSLAEKLMFP
ncbi:hypothetical protein RJ641_017404 [Dillenia turbinata]|uniref:Uncharacterized protein n=1 Tax=Dillenia turbinata TaxID=194707 RepID=A0AAN8UY13_9MAGN